MYTVVMTRPTPINTPPILTCILPTPTHTSFLTHLHPSHTVLPTHTLFLTHLHSFLPHTHTHPTPHTQTKPEVPVCNHNPVAKVYIYPYINTTQVQVYIYIYIYIPLNFQNIVGLRLYYLSLASYKKSLIISQYIAWWELHGSRNCWCGSHV